MGDCSLMQVQVNEYDLYRSKGENDDYERKCEFN
jgi:hypothetical protein